jgi:hypothetical protein
MSNSNSPKSAEKLSTEERLKLVNDSLKKFNEEMAPLEKRVNDLKRDIERVNSEKSKLMEKLIKEKDKEKEKLEREKKKEVDRLEKIRVEKERELERKKLENKKLERECGDLEIDKYLAEERLKSKTAKAAKAEELEKSLKKTEAELQQHKEAIRSIAKVSTMSTNPDSSIYLFNLGTTEELKSIFKIPAERISDKICIYKFGLTNDINRRETEHSQKFIRKGCKNFKRAFVKPSSIIVNRDNENKLFDYFKKNDYTFIFEEVTGKDKYKELVCIGETEFKKVVNFYKKELE